MNDASPHTRTVIVERDFPHPAEKIWRALTQPHLIEAWLMKSDFAPVPGHRFSFNADWGSVACEVVVIEPNSSLSYTWSAMGLESVVTWTLCPTSTGTHLRMEQTGFRPEQEQAYRGAQTGWTTFMAELENVLSRED
ncbi:SRPBCC domain-containing protein [Massilia sp. CCM 9210]|uniref:SRPBCC family protein n=1 Tax=Massilia scottii TaxID=3057166 RepID=UPI002796DC17|nr:SRPBCC domain-containing protein [Massilia sp. CCM 9210]MDQ1817350.1 SRPBCC domain-containing protein [Massilia sp. CCM 9210]